MHKPLLKPTKLFLLVCALLCMFGIWKYVKHRAYLTKRALSLEEIHDRHESLRVVWEVLDAVNHYTKTNGGRLPGEKGVRDQTSWCHAVQSYLGYDLVVISKDACTIQNAPNRFQTIIFNTSYSGALAQVDDSNRNEILFRCPENGKVITLDYLDVK